MEKLIEITDKRTWFAILITLLLVLNFILSSCGTARRGEPLVGRLTVSNENVNHGKQVFMTNCQKCHPGGEAGEGPSINNIHLPGTLLKVRVRSKAFVLGLGRMPSFKKDEIARGDLRDLIAYLKATRKISNYSHPTKEWAKQ